MQTITEHIAELEAEFRRLSASRRATLRRQAEGYCQAYPHMACASGYWRGLSARQVIAAATQQR
jgi:hypothetical protein